MQAAGQGQRDSRVWQWILEGSWSLSPRSLGPRGDLFWQGPARCRGLTQQREAQAEERAGSVAGVRQSIVPRRQGWLWRQDGVREV